MQESHYSRLSKPTQEKVDGYIKGLKLAVRMKLEGQSLRKIRETSAIKAHLGTARSFTRYWGVVKNAPERDWRDLIASRFVTAEDKKTARRTISPVVDAALDQFISKTRFFSAADLARVAAEAAHSAGESPPPGPRWFQRHIPGNYR